MKKEIYSSAWDSVTMSDECLGEILDSIEDVPVITKRPRKKVSYLAVLTAAVVFMTGGITAAAQAGAFDWIKGFFAPNSIANVEEFSDIIGEMKDFKCEGNMGAEFSPVGVIYDGNELNCMLKIDKLSEGMKKESLIDNCSIGELKVNGKYPWELLPDPEAVPHGSSFAWSLVDSRGENYAVNDYDPESLDSLAIQADICGDYGSKIIKDGDRISIKIDYFPNGDMYEEKENKTVRSSEISFTLQEGRYSILNIDYSKYTCDEIPKRQYDFLIDKLTITSLKAESVGKGEFYADTMIGDELKVVLEDGTEVSNKIEGKRGHSGAVSAEAMVTAWNNGSSTLYEGGLDEEQIQYLPTVKERVEARGEPQVVSVWYFSKPIDPDKVVKVYLGDMCIYKR